MTNPRKYANAAVSRVRAFGRRFRAGQDGSVVVVFAVSLLSIMMFIGMAVDIGAAYSTKAKLDAIADSASLAGASIARSAFLSDGVGNSSKTNVILESARETASTFFSSQLPDFGNVDAAPSTDVELVNGQITSTVSYTATYRPHLLSLLGYSEMALTGESVAAAAIVPYMEVTLLIDTSGSMAIGADEHEQILLKNQIGCAFACHDNVAVKGYADAYVYAKAKGITLRYDAVNKGIGNLIDEFDALDPGASAIKASIRSFDTKFAIKQAMTPSRSKLRWNMPTAPATSGETDGATKFNEGIGAVVAAIGNGGSGASPASPIKMLIIATDGVQDPGRFWVTQTQYRKDVAPFDMSFCDKLKAKGVQVGILHTPYIPMTDDWGYNATLGEPSQLGNPGTRADDVPRVLKACAGNLYFEATSSDAVTAGFVSILRSSNVPRLVM